MQSSYPVIGSKIDITFAGARESGVNYIEVDAQMFIELSRLPNPARAQHGIATSAPMSPPLTILIIGIDSGVSAYGAEHLRLATASLHQKFRGTLPSAASPSLYTIDPAPPKFAEPLTMAYLFYTLTFFSLILATGKLQ